MAAGCAGLLSWPVAPAAFVAPAEPVLTEPQPVAMLGIEETRRGRPTWRRGEDGRWRLTERVETTVGDLAGGHGLLGQTAGRTKKAVVDWLHARGEAWKTGVRIVAMDPCASSRAAVTEALPNARSVADHVPLVRLANQAVTEVRRRVRFDTYGRRGRNSDPAGASRRRLLRGRERLSPTAFARRWNERVDADTTDQILTAWIAKQELPALLATARRGGQRHDVAHRLHRCYDWCARSDIPELHRRAATIDAWWPQVLGFLETTVTNAATEATNQTVNTGARTAYGFRNRDHQRRRVRYACTRHQRRVSAVARR